MHIWESLFDCVLKLGGMNRWIGWVGLGFGDETKVRGNEGHYSLLG